jgi:hypothetical protein
VDPDVPALVSEPPPELECGWLWLGALPLLLSPLAAPLPRLHGCLGLGLRTRPHHQCLAYRALMSSRDTLWGQGHTACMVSWIFLSVGLNATAPVVKAECATSTAVRRGLATGDTDATQMFFNKWHAQQQARTSA